ncbi:ATP-binding protein [Streptomyces sp. Je 1-79]|uniref:ATP-binding protein n=1 Tax=Streptomyces sp. Je 1-79 TaxID=2943847 RepID=UPI0021A6D6CD|nr:ATP-binding protein [Streptomyces sp. Je 1-79]MCT4357501.1 ATP-binding protein [Streptomyces sp. Je 1-79]
MQHAVGAPLPPDPSGWTPGAGRPPVPPAPQGGHQAPHPHPHPHPQPQSPPHAGPPGPSAAPQAPGSAAPYSAPPAPGWGSAGVPAHPGQPGSPQRDVTGHVPLPPVALPVPPPAEPGTGAATLAVLLIGPAGAGKTTVARHWAQRRRVPTAHISLDDVREWVCSGFADPQSGWNEHSEAQYRLARRTCGFAARNFLANGISCIVDDAVFPDRPVVGLGGWKRHVGPGLLPVVLLPGLEIVLERNAERSGNRRLSDEEVASIHGRMAGWYGSGLPIIDNSTYDVETTARVLDEVLARSIASPPAW